MTSYPTADAPLYDIHVHYVPGWWYESVNGAAASVHPDISNLELVLAGARDGYGSKRTLNAPVETLYGTQRVDLEKLRELNRSVAEAVAEHPEALFGLASIDAFSGEAAGDEVRYAARELGLAGIVVDSGRGDAVLGQPQTVPALAAAAEAGVPVFVHPVWTQDADRLRAATGQKAAGFGRGYRNGLAVLQVLESGLLKTIPGLKLIFTALGTGALYFAHQGLEELRLATGETPPVYFDTTSVHPASIRYAVDVLGPERVVIGTDWPFHDDDRQTIVSAVTKLGLSPGEEDAILRGNVQSLFTRNIGT